MAASDGDGWSTLSQAATTDRAPVRRSAGRRWLTALTVLVVATLVVVGGAFLAESVARGFTEDAVTAAVEANLPSNVEGTVDVDIAGDWVILQILSGRMDEITISSDDITFDGIPVDFLTVTASGVPIDLKSPVSSLAATVELDQAGLNELLTLPGNDPELVLGEGDVTYEDSATVLGFDVGYRVTATLAPDGTDVLLSPEAAELTSSIGSIDASRVLDLIVGDEPVRVCAADKLPLGVTISRIAVLEGVGTLSLAASDFTLSGKDLRAKGECQE